MGFLRKAFDFVAHPSHSRTMGLVLMLILVVAVSLTVYVAQQQQTLRQRAAESCNTIRECTDTEKANSVCDKKNDTCRIGTDVFQCQ